ncbi:chitobiase/beta-hexosaminidase C-terminal domain-containing protein [Patescibacteria group bacterium]|jgi:hypothetical protein|nr:chitobiase/beta-hexosaminidase C-terminal domain-containing protein [Patescibacteria group bacterium]
MNHFNHVVALLRSSQVMLGRRQSILLLAVCTCSFFLLLGARPAAAATCTFASVGNSDFNTAGNWTCGHVPTTGDDATIPVSTSTSLSASAAFNSLTVNGTLSGVSFDLDIASTVDIGGSGTFNLGSGTVTSTGNLTNAGTVNNGTGILSVMADFTNGGTYNSDTGIFRVAGSASQSITGGGLTTYYDFVSIKTGGAATFVTGAGTIVNNLTTSGAGTLSGAAVGIAVTGFSTIGANTVVTSTSGEINLLSDVTNNGSLGSNSGNIPFGGGIQNNGTLDVGSGAMSVNSSITNSGTINGGSGTITLNGDFTNTGTFNAGVSTFALNQGSTQNITGSTFYNFTSTKKSGSIATFVTSDATVLGALTTSNNNRLETGAFNLTVVGSSSIGASTVVTSTTGIINLRGATTIDGSLGSSNGGIIFGSTVTNGGTFDVGSGSSTAIGEFTNNGTLNGGTGTLHVLGDFILNFGTVNPGTGTVDFTGPATQTIDPGFGNGSITLYDFTVTKSAATATLTTTLIITHDATLSGDGSFFNNGGTIQVAGNWTDSNSVLTGSGLVEFNGTTAQSVSAEPGFGSVLISNTTATTTFNGDTAISGDLDVSGLLDPTLVTIGGDLNINAGGSYTGTDMTITVTGNLLCAPTGVLILDGTSSLSIGGRADINAGCTVTETTGSAISITGVTALGGTLTLGGGSSTFIGNINSTGTIDGTGAGRLYVGGDWTNGGTYTPGNTAVTFNGTTQAINGSATFYDLTKETSVTDSLVFEAGATTTILHTLVLRGVTSNLLSLDSSVSGTEWYIDPQGTRTIDYVNVQDSNNMNATAIVVGSNNIDSGNNTNWTFDATPPSTPTASPSAGTYTGTQSVTLSSSGATSIRYTTNGSTPTCTSGTVYSGAITISSTLTVKAVGCDDVLNVSTVASFAYVISTGGGGGPGGTPSVVPTSGTAQTPLTLSLDHLESLGDGTIRVWIRLNADPNSVRGYALSTDPSLANASLLNYQPLVSFVVPANPNIVTIYGRYYSTSGDPSALLSLTVDLPTGTVLAPPSGQPSSSDTGSSGIVWNPSDLANLIASSGHACEVGQQDLVLKQVNADAKEFGLEVTPAQANAMRNFVLCGISPATVQFGTGERRAILRDYMETVHRSEVIWNDVERIATGRIPINRNLAIEQRRVGTVLTTFRQIYGHDPAFGNSEENLAWNTMMYRIRFPRDLNLETVGIRRYVALFRHNPVTPFGWSVVRVLGYIKP